MAINRAKWEGRKTQLSPDSIKRMAFRYQYGVIVALLIVFAIMSMNVNMGVATRILRKAIEVELEVPGVAEVEVEVPGDP